MSLFSVYHYRFGIYYIGKYRLTHYSDTGTIYSTPTMPEVSRALISDRGLRFTRFEWRNDISDDPEDESVQLAFLPSIRIARK